MRAISSTAPDGGLSLAAVVSVALGTARLRAVTRTTGVSTSGRLSSTARTPKLVTAGSVRLGRGVAFRAPRVPALVGAAKDAELVIGAGTFVNEGVTIVAQRSIRVGENCRIGDFAAVFDSGYHATDPETGTVVAPTELCDNVWLGRAAMVLPGVTVGCNSVVAAGAVVTADVPANTLVAGTPARPVRTLTIPHGWVRS